MWSEYDPWISKVVQPLQRLGVVKGGIVLLLSFAPLALIYYWTSLSG